MLFDIYLQRLIRLNFLKLYNMKRLLLLLGCTISSVVLFATTYTSTGNGLWGQGTGNVWSGNNAPTSLSGGDQIIISSNNTITDGTLGSFPSQAHLVVKNGARLTITTTVTFNGSTIIEVETGGTLDFQGTVQFGTKADITIAQGGTINIGGAATLLSQSSITINNAGTFYLNSNFNIVHSDITVDGSLIVNGSISNSGSSSIAGSGSVLVAGTSSSGTLDISTSNKVILSAKIWTGNTSTDWATGTNWVGTGSNVAIPAVVTGKYYPTLPGGTFTYTGDMTILGGAEITIAGNTTIAGNLTIESNTSSGTGSVYRSSGSLTVTGTTTVKQYVTSGRYWYITNPVIGASLDVNGAQSWTWSETAQKYNSGPSTTLGQGFVVKPSTDGQISFIGNTTNTLNFGTVSPAITNTAGTYSGYSLIGNPFPSYLDWSLVYSANNGITSTISYSVSGNFATYNANGGSVTNGASRYIPPMQAIWIHTPSTGVLSLPYSNCVSRPASAIKLKSNIEDSSKSVRLRVASGKFTDEHLLVMNSQAQDKFDAWDSEKRFADVDSFPQIYSLVDSKKLIINAMSSPDSVGVVPVFFTTKFKGTFNIGAPEITGLSGYSITLFDRAVNKAIDLTDVPSYSFTSAVTSDSNRFELRLKANATTTFNKERAKNKSITVYANSESIIINIDGTLADDNSVVVYNTLGQVVAQTAIVSNKTVVTGNFAAGSYFVKVKKGNTVITKTVEKL